MIARLAWLAIAPFVPLAPYAGHRRVANPIVQLRRPRRNSEIETKGAS